MTENKQSAGKSIELQKDIRRSRIVFVCSREQFTASLLFTATLLLHKVMELMLHKRPSCQLTFRCYCVDACVYDSVFCSVYLLFKFPK